MRSDIERVTILHKLTVEEHFKNAAKELAPDLKPKEIQRKLLRFQEGCSPPDFVKRHTLKVLEGHPSSQ